MSQVKVSRSDLESVTWANPFFHQSWRLHWEVSPVNHEVPISLVLYKNKVISNYDLCNFPMHQNQDAIAALWRNIAAEINAGNRCQKLPNSGLSALIPWIYNLLGHLHLLCTHTTDISMRAFEFILVQGCYITTSLFLLRLILTLWLSQWEQCWFKRTLVIWLVLDLTRLDLFDVNAAWACTAAQYEDSVECMGGD